MAPPFLHPEDYSPRRECGIEQIPLSHALLALLCSLSMRLLFTIAAICCVILLAGIAALWWKLQRLQSPVRQQAQRKPPQREHRQHPRLDLAAGMVPPAQTVRPRAREQDLRKDKASITPDTSLRKRPDRAYFNADMGDLRDPDIGIPPAGGVLRPSGTLSKPEYR